MLPPTRNLLLNVLSQECRDAITSQCRFVELPIRSSLQGQEEKPRYHYFITAGVTSVVVNLLDGGTSETGLIGYEGVTGAISLLGAAVPPTTVFTQVEGSAYRIPHGALQEMFNESTEIRTRILEVVQMTSMTTSQLAACNNSHDAESRLARWLLMVQDRTQLEEFALTQEFLADMLGTRRTTVAVAAGALQRAGFIDYKRGRMQILSRENLEAAACDCYPVTQRLLQALYRR